MIEIALAFVVGQITAYISVWFYWNKNMNLEYVRLRDATLPFEKCPKCLQTFEQFLRGLVCSYWRKWFGRRYSCVICRNCKEIVGYE